MRSLKLFFRFSTRNLAVEWILFWLTKLCNKLTFLDLRLLSILFLPLLVLIFLICFQPESLVLHFLYCSFLFAFIPISQNFSNFPNFQFPSHWLTDLSYYTLFHTSSYLILHSMMAVMKVIYQLPNNYSLFPFPLWLECCNTDMLTNYVALSPWVKQANLWPEILSHNEKITGTASLLLLARLTSCGSVSVTFLLFFLLYSK